MYKSLVLTLSGRPGSDAVLHISRIEFELRPTQINLGQAELIQTPIFIPTELNLKSVHFGKLHLKDLCI